MCVCAFQSYTKNWVHFNFIVMVNKPVISISKTPGGRKYSHAQDHSGYVTGATATTFVGQSKPLKFQFTMFAT